MGNCKNWDWLTKWHCFLLLIVNEPFILIHSLVLSFCDLEIKLCFSNYTPFLSALTIPSLGKQLSKSLHRSKAAQMLGILRTLQGLFRQRLLLPTLESDSVGLGQVWGFAFLTSSLETLIPWVQGPPFEDHKCVRNCENPEDQKHTISECNCTYISQGACKYTEGIWVLPQTAYCVARVPAWQAWCWSREQ